MKNQLLVPEIREMLAAKQMEELQDFCVSTPPSIVADFLGPLVSSEIAEILNTLSLEDRASLFVYFDDDVKISLLDALEKEEVISLVSAIPEAERFDFLKNLSEETKQRITGLIKKAQREDLLKLLPPTEAELDLSLPEEPLGSEETVKFDIHKTKNGKLERCHKIEKDCWINVVNPTKEDLLFLAQKFEIPADFLTAPLDIDEIARTESERGITLIIQKSPFFDEKSLDILYFTVPIGIILAKDFIITVCSKESVVIQDFINGKVKNFSTLNRQRFVLQVFLRSTMLFLQYLKQINNATNVIQKKLEQSSKNQQLIKLLNIEKSLVFFTTSLKSNALMLERMQKMTAGATDEETQNLFDDIIIESKQAIEMANIYSDILSGMMDAFASIISNNLNMVMKALTLFTIILTIPILLASLYGMNVKLPLQDSPHAFYGIIGVATVFALLGFGFFIKKKWLD